jgi:hypothetical protein
MSRRSKSIPQLPREATCTLPTGQTLTPGVEVSVRTEAGETGRFAYHALFTPDQSLVCFGPVTSAGGSWRAFPQSAVRRVHRNITPRKKAS